MSRVLILNGPPESGKDIAAKAIVKHLHDNYDCAVHEFKEHIYKQVQLFYSLSDENMVYLYFGKYARKHKELPQTLLDGKTPREALIHMSEVVTKPNFGQDYYGKVASKYKEDLIVFSDGGFEKEIEELVKVHGFDNVAVVRIYRDGTNYDNDSRDYFKDGLVGTYFDIQNFMPFGKNNDGEFNDFIKKVIRIGEQFYEAY